MKQMPDNINVRYVTQVPENAVAISYIYNSPLDTENSLQINDLSRLILENQELPSTHFVGYVDEFHQLHQTRYVADIENITTIRESEIGTAIDRIESQIFMIAHTWMQGEPLFFSHTLTHTVYELNPISIDYSDKILILDKNSRPIRRIHKWKAKLVQTDTPNYYQVVIYTSFQSSSNTHFFATYTASPIGESPRPKFVEFLNPQAAFKKAESLEQCIASKTNLYSQSDYGMIHSKVFVPFKAVRDTRSATPFTWRLCGEAQGGQIVYSPIFSDSVFPNNIVLTHDFNYTNGRKMLSSRKAQEILGDHTNQVITRYWAESLTDNISCHTKSDGSGEIYAYNHKSNATGLNHLPEKYIVINKTEFFGGTLRTYQILAPIVSLKLLDRRPIRVLPPIYDDTSNGWHIRVQSGWFQKTISTNMGNVQNVIFKVSEFDSQHFDPQYGKPIKKAIHETPKIIGDYHIQLKNRNLHIEINHAGDPTNITVLVNNQQSEIKQWNTIDAIIELDHQLNTSDDIKVTYNYHETNYIYRGFLEKRQTETAERLQFLDLNPTKSHYCSKQGLHPNNFIFSTVVPSAHLINHTIYVYIVPVLRITETEPYVIPIQSVTRSLKHSFSPIDEPDHILLATIRVRPNSIPENTKLIDVRVRGGGIKEQLTAQHNITESYFDIGNWDGYPFSENAVLVIKIPRNILVEYGGNFTVDKIDRIINKHVACGVLCLTEFV